LDCNIVLCCTTDIKYLIEFYRNYTYLVHTYIASGGTNFLHLYQQTLQTLQTLQNDTSDILTYTNTYNKYMKKLLYTTEAGFIDEHEEHDITIMIDRLMVPSVVNHRIVVVILYHQYNHRNYQCCMKQCCMKREA
jgi:hypothetical protein